MKPRDLIEFVTLAAIWGASFLFMRIAVPAFGPLVVADLRTAIAAVVLLALVAWRGGLTELAPNALRFLVLGAFNSAIPFTLFAYAALSITAGLASILNATVPLFAALVAWIWLRDRLTWLQWLGLAIGFGGVLWLSADSASFKPGGADGRLLRHSLRRCRMAFRARWPSATSAISVPLRWRLAVRSAPPPC